MSSLPTSREEYRAWWEANAPVPYGYCWCGCGEKTNPSTATLQDRPVYKGLPCHYRKAHSFRVKTRYVEEDRGYTTPCWIWQLKIADNGYGHVTVGNTTKLAHRYYYEQYKGSIAARLSIDHLCRVRECVNPDHLEAVPLYVNQRRGSKILLSVELVEALREAHKCGVMPSTLETLTGIKRRTLQAAIYGENWSKAG